MKIINLIIALIMLHTQQALSNNVQVSNVRLTAQDTADNFTLVEFDISWDNSWRYSGGPANWDAAWIFVKYKVEAGGQWQHAWLNNTGHTACGNSTITNGFLNPELPFHSSTNPSLGVFMYRSAPGSGSFTCQDVQLRWNYGSNSVSDDAQVDIKVFAIEMVYIPQGSFYVGSGGTEVGAFYTYPNSTDPFYITSEAAITVGTQPGNLFYDLLGGVSGDQQGPVPAAFPKGFKAFYAMKYEISQQGYLEFLNVLTRQQQISRVGSNISGTTVTNQYVMSNTSSAVNRSYIKCLGSIPSAPAIVDFFCDYNNNGTGGEDGDGQNVACNFLSSYDLYAYLDWTCLRPISELEFEKCGRGSQLPLPNEYAWGNNNYRYHTGINNYSLSNEIPTDPMANIVSGVSNGPLRVGSFARTNSNRTTSGAGYFGCLELSSNVYELAISIGNVQGRAYEGKHGNGMLTATGLHDVSTWPNVSNNTGGCIRGGSLGLPLIDARISDRRFGADIGTDRLISSGGRGVRTAQ